MKPDPARVELGNYPYSIEIPTRFGDVDIQMHINNVAIVQLFEESRVRFSLFFQEIRFGDFRQAARIVVKDMRFSYLREVTYPEPVTVGVGVKHIGNTSYQIGCGMFQNGVCVALNDAVSVCSNGARAIPLPDAIGEVLPRYLIANLQPS